MYSPPATGRKVNHILVVDDEEMLLHSLNLVLLREGFKVTTAKDGQAAIAKFLAAQNSSTPIEAIITDLQMPHLTGIEFINELKRMGIDLPILIISGASERDVKSALRSNAHLKYIGKPFTPHELIERITRLLEGE